MAEIQVVEYTAKPLPEKVFQTCSVAMIPSRTTDTLSSKPTTHTKRAQPQKKLRCKLYTTPFANTSRRAKRNPRLRTPSPNLRLITEITVSTFQR
jgi:hypothetical protein